MPVSEPTAMGSTGPVTGYILPDYSKIVGSCPPIDPVSIR